MKHNQIIIWDFYQGQWNVFCRKDCKELLNKFAFTATLIRKWNTLFKHKIVVIAWLWKYKLFCVCVWLQRVQCCCQTHQVRSDSSYEHLNFWSSILRLHYTNLLNFKNEKACVQIQSFETSLHKETHIKLCLFVS